MKVKASLHLHSHEDTEDGIVVKYSIYELIDAAVTADIKVLASTCHLHVMCDAKAISYAKSKGILLIAGTELEVNGKHMLVLNCDKSVESISTFQDLKEYKEKHPEIFVIVPHPNHGMFVSLSIRRMKKYGSLIDAVEHSWFYAKLLNPNKRVKRICAELKLPFIATADLHLMKYLTTDYAVIDVKELTTESVFSAIRANKFENVSSPKTVWQLIDFIFRLQVMEIFAHIFKR